MKTRCIHRILKTAVGAALLAGGLSTSTWGQVLAAEPFHKTGIYDLGEKAGWTLTLPPGAAAPSAPYNYTIKTNNSTTVKQGQLDLSSGKATLEFTLDQPAMAYVQIAPPAGVGGPGGGVGGGRATRTRRRGRRPDARRGDCPRQAPARGLQARRF